MTWFATDIGLLPGGNFSLALATNSDGSVIVGLADSDGFGDGHAFWWTEASGMVDLGVLAGGFISIAQAVSADGQWVVGYSDGGSAPPGNTVAVLWHVTAGGATVVATELGFLATGDGSAASGISDDGTTVVGTSAVIPGGFINPTRPFSWTSGGGMVDLGLFSTNTNGIGQAASATGSVIAGGSNDAADVPWFWDGSLHAIPLASTQTTGVGWALSDAGTEATGFSTDVTISNKHAFLWSGGTTVLIGEPGITDQSWGTGISADGTIIVGQAGNYPNFTSAFYWTDADGFVDLPPLSAGGTNAVAHGISADGLIPVGSSNAGEFFQHAVFWSQTEAPISTTMADLWFSNTSGFVDLTDVTNRRKFISDTGGAQNLGPDGSTPFGVAPVVFLTRNGVPDTFAVNNGRGGEFGITGGDLAAGASAPMGTSTSVTTGGSFSPGKGVLGDYRNGNLYAFNPATYLDNGTQRKWVRRWRGMPSATMVATRFSYLAIAMQTGIGVPPTDNPQVMLRWSDDGGRSWSNYRLLSVGKTGQTAFTVKANRLGSTRRFAGSDRIFELSSTDPFGVAILDAEVDVS